MKTKAKITRKDTREHLAQFHLACELVKVIHHYFPGLLSLLKRLEDPRGQRYITYESHVLLMARILSSIFYISSMRKTSQEFNSDTVIENIGYLCGRPELPELPYWERINDYLKRLDPSQLQGVVCGLVRRLLWSRVFEDSRIRGRYWQVIVDGTQLESSRRELDPKSLYRIHRKGTPEEYREYYYYVLEAKLVLRNDILVSIMTEFVENEGSEDEKQDCERKACRRLLKKLHGEFPRLPVCLSADSLYACEPFFEECRGYGYHYILRFKEGSIPYVADEFGTLRNREGNLQKEETEEMTLWSDYVNGKEECLEEIPAIPKMMLSLEENNKLSQIYGTIENIVNAYQMDAVMNGTTDEGWDKFKQDLNAAGMEELVAIYQGAYDRYCSFGQ